MKNLLIPLCIAITVNLSAQESDYVMYQTIQLTPKSGHEIDLMDGLKAHTDKLPYWRRRRSICLVHPFR